MPVLLLRGGNAIKHKDYMIDIGMPFEMICSNYSLEIKAEGLDQKYVATFQSKRAFACFAKLKSDLKDKPIPDIRREDCSYFQHNFKNPMYIEQVINIDLKSAYATILFNDGFISESTFKYLCGASKKERLASVGMLASRKKSFSFNHGEPFSYSEKINERAGFFFYAVKRTYEIMDELKRIAGQKYLYTWVDGIYSLPNDTVQFESCSYLDSIGFKYTVDSLSEFEVKIKPDTVNVTFKKEGKRKIFNLPSLSTDFKRITIDAIISINKKHKDAQSKLSKNAIRYGADR